MVRASQNKSRLFHTLVVVGAGVTVSSCGGKTQSEAANGESSAGPGGNATNTGGQAGHKEINPVFTTDTSGVGGGVIVLDDASIVLVGAGGGSVVIGPSSQWTCTTFEDQCTGLEIDGSYLSAYAPQSCSWDSTRPRSSAECAPEQWFACELASYAGQVLPVNCACVPMGDAGCDPADCRGDPRTRNLITCFDHSRLCGCAVTGIR